jgi:monofunctional biosynthetic peptidoglycan transglycosylase
MPEEMQKARKPRFKLKKIVLWTFLAFLGITAALVLYTWITLPDVSGLKTANPASTSLMRLQAAEAAKKGIKISAHQEWIAFDRVPELMKKAVLISEDANFYSHKGIDFAELRESIKQDIRERRFVRGGSTITQQLAKNLYLSGDKTLWRKFTEALIARRLERALPKNRIFVLYLNVIELGPNVFGVQAASRHWFGKDVGELTLEEMVRLTAIIPRPLKSDPRANDAWMKFKGRWIADTLLAVKAIGDEDHQALVRAFE